MMSTPPFKFSDLFAPAEENHRCCTCCSGYCPAQDGALDDPRAPASTYRIGDYISDRYVAIREALISGTPDSVIDRAELPAAMSIPGEKPAESTALFTPAHAIRLLNQGLTIHQGESDKGPQHVYLGDEHIGWISPNTTQGVTLDHLRTLDAAWKQISQPDNAKSVTRALIHDLGGHPLDALEILRRAADEEWAR